MTLICHILVLLFSCGFTREGDEQEAVSRLITTTERQLSSQRALQKLMDRFQAEQNAFMLGGQTREQANQMVETADQILKIVEENHYADALPSPYVEELRLFSRIANKQAPTPP